MRKDIPTLSFGSLKISTDISTPAIFRRSGLSPLSKPAIMRSGCASLSLSARENDGGWRFPVKHQTFQSGEQGENHEEFLDTVRESSVCRFRVACLLASDSAALASSNFSPGSRPRSTQAIVANPRRVRHQLRPAARSLSPMEPLVVDAHVRCRFQM